MNDYSHIIASRIDSIALIHKRENTVTDIPTRQFYGLSFCREGELRYFFNGREYISNPQTAIFLPCGQRYQIYCAKAGDFPLINFSCTADCMPDDFLVLPIADIDPYDLHFVSMTNAVKSMADCRYKLLSSFYAIMNRLTQESLRLVNIPEILQPGVNYLHTHLYDSALTNGDLAAHAHISEVYFRRVFHQVFGVSPHQYILAKRIERSVDLLKYRSISIPEIAALCGFSTVANYYRSFRQQMNCTPNEFRKKNILS